MDFSPVETTPGEEHWFFDLPEGVSGEDISPFEIDWGVDLPKQTAEFSVAEDAADLPRIDEDDYTEEQAALLNVLKKAVRDACNVNTSWEKRKKAMQWCFTRGQKNRQGIDFHTACLALGARPEVVLARLHHQLYVAGVPIREPMSIWIEPLPERYESEAIMAAWDDGIKILREVWRWPGIPIDILEQASGLQDPMRVMEKLAASGLIAWRFGCVFLTGRSPERVRSRSFSWSASFL